MAASGTRERVLDAALASFGTRGFEATSLDAVAAELGIRKQTILYYFPNKDALLSGVIDASADELIVELERTLGRAGEGWGRIEAVVRKVFRLAARRPALLGLLREVSRLGPPASVQLVARLDPLVKRAHSFLEAEMAAGRMRQRDPGLVLIALYSVVTGVALEVEVLGAVTPPHEREQQALRSLVRRRNELLALLRDGLVA
jgi:TetR/AcrR family transcriptional regulator